MFVRIATQKRGDKIYRHLQIAEAFRDPNKDVPPKLQGDLRPHSGLFARTFLSACWRCSWNGGCATGCKRCPLQGLCRRCSRSKVGELTVNDKRMTMTTGITTEQKEILNRLGIKQMPAQFPAGKGVV